MTTPLLLAHRGYSGKYPENTMLAFSKALEFGADGIECDLQRTKDGHFIVMHDETLDRTTTGRGRVDEFRLEELSQFKCGGGQEILTLESLLKWMPKDKVINIEVKAGTIHTEDLPALIAQIRALRGEVQGSDEKTIISSFEHSWLLPFKRAGFETGMLFGDEDKGRGALALLKSVFEIKPTYLHLPVQMFEVMGRIPAKGLLAAFKFLGNRFNFWTVNTKPEFKQVRRLCKMIITDHVEHAVDWRSQ